jgi:hypothetical protein
MFLATANPGTGSTKTKPSSTHSTVKKSEESLKLPERRKYRHADKITVRYDKFKDQTLLGINWPNGMKVDHTSFAIDFLFTFSGQRLAQPVRPSSKLTLMISSESETWKYLQFGHDLDLLVDGERMSIGTLHHEGSVGNGYVLESMSAQISAALFLRLANAKSIEGKLSQTEFSLSSDQIETIKDFASRLSGGSVGEFRDAGSLP